MAGPKDNLIEQVTDNPTIGQELMADWLADRFRIDQRALAARSLSPLV